MKTHRTTVTSTMPLNHFHHLPFQKPQGIMQRPFVEITQQPPEKVRVVVQRGKQMQSTPGYNKAITSNPNYQQ